MPYASQVNMVAQFGEREVIALTDRARVGLIDVGVLNDALNRASSLIDSYLSDRFGAPLTSTPVEIIDACCDIARYKLCGSDALGSDEIRNRYKDALKLLQMVRDRELNIGLTAAGAAIVETAGVRFTSRARAFTPDGLLGRI